MHIISFRRYVKEFESCKRCCHLHTAVVKVRAEVCLHCGERLYSPETVRRFEQIRAKLEREEVDDFRPLGRSFAVV
ncbi:MAG TPA: YgiT-type zinc finger protein [Candidatus Latescibacteria bacterium]|nr:YgiT-type zinc finger protein [Candidatus Latescibacterota bacterium]